MRMWGWLFILAGVFLAIGWMSLSVVESGELAPAPQSIVQQDGDEESDEPEPPTNDYCLLCHSKPDQVWVLRSGEALSVTVDADVLANSVHGEANPEGPLACADCHFDHRFPHSEPPVQSIREFQLERYAACRTCHEDQYLHAQDSVHGVALREGRLEAAVCVDCHGGHDVQPPDEPRQRVSLTCGGCHGAIFDEYQGSIHGSALLEEGNPDVPTCIDCHGVHGIQNPTNALFRSRSPELCADCHADNELMGKYDISTNVFDSYLTDFHGSTVALFEQQDPESPSNKAVCFDCHGIHNITEVDDDHSTVAKENLLATCQQCHPDATSDFPDAWVGHFAPTADSNALLFAVNQFYKILIPLVLGGLGLLVASDVFGRIRMSVFGERGDHGS